jgi:hypothetical protein
MRTRIIENEFIESNDKFSLYMKGQSYLGEIRLEFDPDYKEFNEKRNSEILKYKDDPEFIAKNYDKPFNADFETIYRENLKEYKADFSQASDKAFIQDEIERLESLKATLRKCLMEDFETPEWKAIGGYCEFLKSKEAGNPLREKKPEEKYSEYYPTLLKVYELCTNDKSQNPVFNCASIDFLEAIEISSFENININVV